MKKVMILILAVVLLLGVSGQAMAAFTSGDLIRIVYDGTTEYATDLGSIQSLTSPISTTAVFSANPIAFSTFGSSTMAQLTVAYYTYTNVNNPGNTSNQVWTSGNSSGGQWNAYRKYASFTTAANSNFSGMAAVAVGSNAQIASTDPNSYEKQMKTSGTLTSYLNVGTAHPGTGTDVTLAALSSTGYVDQYLYYYSPSQNAPTYGGGPGTQIATIRTFADGHTELMPVVVAPVPPLLGETFGAASIQFNGSTILSFTVQNNNAANNLTGVGFSDTLPAGLVVSTPNGLTGSCGGGMITAIAGTNAISLSGASLSQSSSCTFSVNVKGIVAGVQNNTTGNVTAVESGAGGTATASIKVIAPKGDFSGGGQSDILWRNSSTGINAIWYMSGHTVSGFDVIDSMPDPAWQIVGVGDFNGNGNNDILWRNSSTGINAMWHMSGHTVTGFDVIDSMPDTAWQIVGVGDFNGDGKSDILWRNSSTGANAIWYMSGNTVTGFDVIDSMPDPAWQIVGVGDFNGNGNNDILWRNSSTGINAMWHMSGHTVTGFDVIDSMPDTAWQIVGVGDYNGDGKSDIVWRNSSTGANAIWYMSGHTVTGFDVINSMPDTTWHIVGPK